MLLSLSDGVIVSAYNEEGSTLADVRGRIEFHLTPVQHSALHVFSDLFYLQVRKKNLSIFIRLRFMVFT